MGDFNATNDSQSPSIKSKLLSFLQHNNMYDLASHTNTSTSTWHSNRYNSCIDYIWANHSLLRYLTSYTTDDPSTCTCSDHNILISTWEFPYAFTGKRRIATKTRRKIFQYKNMTNELWQNFTDQVSSNLKPNHTSSSTQTTDSLETTWHKIQTSIISAAHVHIPNKKFTVRNFQHIFSSKASQLHSYLKKLGNIIRQIKASIKHQLIIPISHNQTI